MLSTFPFVINEKQTMPDETTARCDRRDLARLHPTLVRILTCAIYDRKIRIASIAKKIPCANRKESLEERESILLLRKAGTPPTAMHAKMAYIIENFTKSFCEVKFLAGDNRVGLEPYF